MTVKCVNCANVIRLTETMGWVHGTPNEGWNAWCDETRTVEAESGLND